MSPPNPIPADGIKQLIAQLGSDLARVEAAAAIPPEQKQNLRLLIGQMRVILRATDRDAEEHWTDWLQDMRPMFDSLSTQLNAALGDAQGACHYAGGCIRTSKPHCDSLSGTFFPGSSC